MLSMPFLMRSSVATARFNRPMSACSLAVFLLASVRAFSKASHTGFMRGDLAKLAGVARMYPRSSLVSGNNCCCPAAPCPDTSPSPAVCLARDNASFNSRMFWSVSVASVTATPRPLCLGSLRYTVLVPDKRPETIRSAWLFTVSRKARLTLPLAITSCASCNISLRPGVEISRSSALSSLLLTYSDIRRNSPDKVLVVSPFSSATFLASSPANCVFISDVSREASDGNSDNLLRTASSCSLNTSTAWS